HKNNSSSHNICHTEACGGKDFPTSIALKEHWVQTPLHAYCQYQCFKHFDDRAELHNHFRDEHPFCDICTKVFANDNGLHGHNMQSHPSVYCTMCKRMFKSPANLTSHLDSSVHRTKDVRCARGCTRKFVSRSTMTRHLESGGCRSTEE
ncbi:hypothetical protein FIBSPDRAFT_749877, partial [Athelia psychrophila]